MIIFYQSNYQIENKQGASQTTGLKNLKHNFKTHDCGVAFRAVENINCDYWSEITAALVYIGSNLAFVWAT
jgi:hypothetical protein